MKNKMISDKRSGKIALIAHCILNQNARALTLAEKPCMITEIIQFLADHDISVIQMPCPELAFAGVLRQPQKREQYDSTIFRKYCRKICRELADQIEQYSEGGVKLKLVIGVNGSPTCSVDDSGIFIEELRLALHKRGISAPFFNIHHKSLSKDIVQLEKLIK